MGRPERNIELLESLLKEAEGLPYRDEAAVDSLQRRAKMLARRIFGEGSPHLAALNNIYFYPRARPSSPIHEDKEWRSGQAEITNLIRTMLEELKEFETTPAPVLTISDAELQKRTGDLLAAPGSYDRVLREATTVLENRIRSNIPHEDLSELIPNAAEQTGDNLVNKLFGGKQPLLVVGDTQTQQGVHRMIGGAFAYMRNPSHHAIDDTVEWSWAWSVVGLVDQLLADIDAAQYQRPKGT